ncbi:MAG: KpsF/GutQ family sugar-phosphate isomerase [Pelagimonas sp.]|uniref:KpsF/GutQ family sugar-phosphate isomerase n=1 Tax=Pelagimonas sp. TaxID=2073170 RepID=UPI003D6C5BCF
MLAKQRTGIDAAARRVLDVEIRGLSQLATELPVDFTPFIEAVLESKGRLIISGIGKSAHIGSKISATLASTGTPSLFVHATEASHGDLGMIVPGDICIVISNSGQTRELQDLVGYCKRFAIPIAGISSNPESVLMRASTYQLLIPKAEEACPIGMAPTTSTTITLALGDAIAVALMEQRGFTADHFKDFHPGGKLGMQLATVGDLMHSAEDLPLVDGETDMQDVLLVMTSRGLGAALVTKEKTLVGIITDGDLRRHMDNLLSKKAADIASGTPLTVSAKDFAAESLSIMNARKINVLAVVDDENRPVGMLHMHDLLRAGVS